jgi:hypothetical protein
VRIPLPLRWSVGGSLRGLGVSLVDETQAFVGEGGRATAILPSRAITIDDRGAEPETPEGEASPPPASPPPPPPLLPVEPFGPIARVVDPSDSRGDSYAWIDSHTSIGWMGARASLGFHARLDSRDSRTSRDSSGPSALASSQVVEVRS